MGTADISPDDWAAIERRVVSSWNAGKTEEALMQIEDVLRRGSSDQRAKALIYRASIREHEDDWVGAKSDFAQAASLFEPGTYGRYTAELTLARAHQTSGEIEKAADSCRAAMRTAASAHEQFSGAAAVRALLTLHPILKAEDAKLAESVVLRSWKVLNLDGVPNLDDLARTAEILLEHGAKRT